MLRGARTSSLDSNDPTRRRRSFSLMPSFRKSTSSSSSSTTRAPHEKVDTAADLERARIRKAAAWQWYTRGVGDVVVPTKSISGPGAPLALWKKEKKPPQLNCSTPSTSGASRFKAEAEAFALRRAPPSPSPPGLFDDFELSGLKTQMSDFVQRLHIEQKQSQVIQTALKPAPAAAAATAEQNSRSTQPLPAAVEEAGSGLHRRDSISDEKSGALRRPISALHRFFRKVLSGSFQKNTSRSCSSAAIIHDPEIVPPPGDGEPEADDVRYHYHHYIHHHHHHYHYGHPSPEAEGDDHLITFRRRHSESSGIRPSRNKEADESSYKDIFEVDGSRPNITGTFLTWQRRRYSDSAFAEHNSTKKLAGGTDVVQMRTPALELQIGHNSERLAISRNKEPNVGSKVDGELELWQNAHVKSRRRHSRTESFRELGDQAVNVISPTVMEEKARGGGGGGRVYKLGGGGPCGQLQGGAAYDYIKHSNAPRRGRHSGSLDAVGSMSGMRDDNMRGSNMKPRRSTLPPVY